MVSYWDHLPMLRFVAAGLPRFSDGRIDYTDSRVALVLNCVVRCRRKILLLRRSDLVSNHRGKWSCLTGFIDQFLNLDVLVACELREELSIDVAAASEVLCSRSFTFIDREASKKWIVYPVQVTFELLPQIRLNWENDEYRWIFPSEIDDFQVIPGQRRALMEVSAAQL
jgi:ADP-ribose pyrophosphatase YjhB (NUDIX family)